VFHGGNDHKRTIRAHSIEWIVVVVACRCGVGVPSSGDAVSFYIVYLYTPDDVDRKCDHHQAVKQDTDEGIEQYAPSDLGWTE